MNEKKICRIGGCENPVKSRGWCDKHYARWHRHGDAEYWGYAPLMDRFWAKVRKGDQCWEWEATTINRGYGIFYVSRKPVLAHRFSYELHFGPIPTGMIVCHHCDNPLCVRPDHLFAGTYSDNSWDMIAKGRHRPCRGENNPKTKLSESEVLDILTRYFTGDVTQADLARAYSIGPSAIFGIVHGTRWVHVYKQFFACNEQGYDMAVTREEYVQGEARRLARLEAAGVTG